jgi:hypothetical protein
MRTLGVIVLCAPCLVGALGAQRNISVDVIVTRIEMRGETSAVSYVVTTRSTSQEPLFRFIVDAPAAVLHINRPAPAESWYVSTRNKGISVASWSILGSIIPTGGRTPILTFDAIGLPTVVTYWATGHFRPKPYQPLPEPAPRPPPREAIAGVTGKTVGVEPFPSDLAPGGLLGRLQGLTNHVCDSLGWVGSATVCSSMRAKLDLASEAVAQRDAPKARSELTSFLAEVDGHHGPALPVNDSAYWLLKVTATFVLGRL